jgi:hypothetical protein
MTLHGTIVNGSIVLDQPVSLPEGTRVDVTVIARTPPDNPPEQLRQTLAETRLPEDLKAKMIAELPSAEEQERLYRELQENGGLSFKQLFNPSDSIELPS